MKKILLLLTLILSQSVSAQFMHLFRNDGQFQTFNLFDGLEIIYEPDEIKISNYPPLPVSAIDSMAFRNADIPLLSFTFPDYPEASTVWNKENYINATLSIDSRGYNADFNIDNLTLQVKGRGNSTWAFEKKPLRLKFPSKTSICGFQKAKSFVLLANYLDNSLMRNSVALWLADRLGVAYANSFLPVDVEINGHYQGSYLLTEKIGINKAAVDIEETEGVLIELGKEYDEKYKFLSELDNLPVMIKDPDFDELYEKNPEGMTPDERLALWEDDFNYAASKAAEGHGEEAFDIDSFARYYFLYNLTLNNEIGFPKSGFLCKERPGTETPYIFGPAWDFDVAFNYPTFESNGTEEISPESSLWANGLMRDVMLSEGFNEAYNAIMEEYLNEIYPDLLDFIDNYALLIEPSAKRDAITWPQVGAISWIWRISPFNTHDNANRLKTWLINRTEFLKTQ